MSNSTKVDIHFYNFMIFVTYREYKIKILTYLQYYCFIIKVSSHFLSNNDNERSKFANSKSDKKAIKIKEKFLSVVEALIQLKR